MHMQLPTPSERHAVGGLIPPMDNGHTHTFNIKHMMRWTIGYTNKTTNKTFVLLFVVLFVCEKNLPNQRHLQKKKIMASPPSSTVNLIIVWNCLSICREMNSIIIGKKWRSLRRSLGRFNMPITLHSTHSVEQISCYLFHYAYNLLLL